MLNLFHDPDARALFQWQQDTSEVRVYGPWLQHHQPVATVTLPVELTIARATPMHIPGRNRAWVEMVLARQLLLSLSFQHILCRGQKSGAGRTDTFFED